MKNKLHFLFLTFLTTINLPFAQEEHDLNLRLKAVITAPVKNKFTFDTELNYRRQSGFDNYNLIDKPYLSALRFWVNYNHKSSVTFGLSPFGFYLNTPKIRKQSDESKPSTPEFRFSGVVKLKYKIAPKIDFINANSFDIRVFDDQNTILRINPKVGLSFTLANFVKMNFHEELRLNVAGVPVNKLLHDNRLGLEFSFKLPQQFTIEFGYLYILKLPFKHLHDHNVVVNLAYSIPKKKEKTVVENSLAK
jgi:hypothetical protein